MTKGPKMLGTKSIDNVSKMKNFTAVSTTEYLLGVKCISKLNLFFIEDGQLLD